MAGIGYVQSSGYSDELGVGIPTGSMWGQMDHARRWQGKVLDAFGFGPATRSSSVVYKQPGFSLLAYDANASGMPVLLVPAPIKRAYIWDLGPGASVVETLLAAGMRVWLLQWEEPDEHSGLGDYADRFISECMDAIQTSAGAGSLVLIGHSLGGLLAALAAALHPERVRGLVAITSPIHFGLSPTLGGLGRVIESLSRASSMATQRGNLPGTMLSLASLMASPSAFGEERIKDWILSLPHTDTARMHMRVERWSLDELPLSRALVAEVIQHLYHEDGFMRGTLRLNGRSVSPHQVVAPLLTVTDERCPIVPPAACLPFHRAAASEHKRLLWYEGDVGVAIRHVGPLVGRSAHEHLWPRIVHWLNAHAGV